MNTPTIFNLALKLPEWVYGRKVILDLCLMYLIINAMARRNKFKA